MDKEAECLEDLRKLINQNEDLSYFSSFFDDQFLLHFVRGKKYDSTKAYKTLVGYINVRSGEYKDWYVSIRPSSFRKLDINPMSILKHRDHLQRLIMLVQLQHWDPREVPMSEALKLVMMGVEDLMNYEDVEKNGIVIIYNCDKLSFRHVRALTPSVFAKVLKMFWNNIPLRYKAIHIVNEMYLVSLIFNAVKPMLPKKLKNRLNFHSCDFNSLHKTLSPNILPQSLGGHLPEKEAFDDQYSERLYSNDDYYQKLSMLLERSVGKK